MTRFHRPHRVVFMSTGCQFILITTLWLYVNITAAAQTDVASESTVNMVTSPRLALKWSPLHLFYFYPSWQFSLEHRLFRNVNIQYEAGWVIHSLQTVPEYQDKRGYRAAVELRYYLPSPRMLSFYVATEFYYHKIRFDRSETVGFNCSAGNCDYFQSVTYPVDSEELGPGLKFGMLLFPGWKKDMPFYLDFNSGFTYRNINYASPSRPSGDGVEYFQNARRWLVFPPDEQISEKGRFIIGVRLCYRFF